jgi:hypothetical protein
MRRVGLIDITVGNATRLGASQRSTTRRCASHHIATQRANRWGHPAALAFSADGHPQAPVAPRRSCAARTYFVAQSWAECITNMPRFHLRQAQAHFHGIIFPSSAGRSKVYRANALPSRAAARLASAPGPPDKGPPLVCALEAEDRAVGLARAPSSCYDVHVRRRPFFGLEEEPPLLRKGSNRAPRLRGRKASLHWARKSESGTT